MSKNKEAIIARLNNHERVNFFPGDYLQSPRGYVVTANGHVCPLETLQECDYLHPIDIVDDMLFSDASYAATNTEFEVNGKEDLKEAVRRYNEQIDVKLREGNSEDDDGSKIVMSHAF